MKTCLDFFSGLGGFSEAFLKQNGWHVIRIDYDPKFKDVPNTHILDLMKVDHLTLNRLGATRPDILVISPPCECFSLMSVYHYWIDGRPKTQKTLDAIALVQKALALKDILKPKYWILENPNGMMVRVLGKPNHYTWWGSWYSDIDPLMIKLKEQGVDLPPLKPTSLWGIFPEIDWKPKPKKGDYQPAPRGAKVGIQDPRLTPEIRSCIPYDFSKALVNGVDSGGIVQDVL